MVFGLALLAAVANAFATVLQRLGVEEASLVGKVNHRLMAAVLRRPIWFVGLALTTGSFMLQAIALSFGNLSTVQPIMVTEILFLVIILGTWFHHALKWTDWVAVFGTAIGLAVFLWLSYSKEGHSVPSKFDWVLLLVASVGAIVLGILAAQRGPRSWRAVCYGVSAGICFALTAAFIKTVANEWPRGVIYVFSHPEAYGVAVAGLIGLIISQHALDAGPVAASQAALLIVNPLSSIIMGIWLFRDHVHATGSRAIVEGVFLGLMFYSLLLLSQSPLISSSREAEQLSDRQSLSKVHAGGSIV
ncbi:MAG TPA: DMT family transporter [Acidimicrobiales bacterium]|nr:DMT family transporter [Acidimicrobiales bacterium]